MNEPSMRSLTPEKKAQVLKAMELAEGPGKCKYVLTNERGVQRPGCVIGQLCCLLGVTLDTLSGYEGRGSMMLAEGGSWRGFNGIQEYQPVPQLAEWVGDGVDSGMTKALLHNLQAAFDESFEGEAAQRAMTNVLTEWENEE